MALVIQTHSVPVYKVTPKSPAAPRMTYNKYMNQTALPSVPILTDAEMLALLAGTVTRT